MSFPKIPWPMTVAPSSLSTLSPCVVHRPLSSLVVAPPLSSCRVVPRPHLSCLRPRSEGTAASPHPSPSRWRRGKIPSIVVVLRSDDDASRRPPPPPLVVSSNICSCSRQRDNIAAPTIVAAACPNVHPREERRRSASASARYVVSDGGRGGRRAPSTPAPCHTPPQQHVDCHFTFKARRCCPPAPATPRLPNDARHRPHAPTIPLALSPSSRWLRLPRRAGAVVVRRLPSSGVCPSSLTALVWGARRDSCNRRQGQ